MSSSGAKCKALFRAHGALEYIPHQIYKHIVPTGLFRYSYLLSRSHAPRGNEFQRRSRVDTIHHRTS